MDETLFSYLNPFWFYFNLNEWIDVNIGTLLWEQLQNMQLNIEHLQFVFWPMILTYLKPN